MPTLHADLDHWRSLPIKQQPLWPDADAVAAVSTEIASLPPPVFAGEVDNLRDRLAKAAAARRFFCRAATGGRRSPAPPPSRSGNRIKTVLQMAVVLTYGACLSWKMGRMAGQFAKPRSSDTETRGDVTPAYRGDIVNGYDFTEVAHGRSAAAAEGVPHRGIHHQSHPCVHAGRLRRPARSAFVEQGLRAEPGESAVRAPATEIDRAIKFMEAAGADFDELKRRVLHGS
ncbi:MAG: 3-deoxy-7-phosphoheptulonate synthase [Microbacterium sp.]